MPEYLSPGVYVEEVPSSIKPIVGVSTSTAAFIGVVPDKNIPMVDENPNFDPTKFDPTKPDPNNPVYLTWTFAPDPHPQDPDKAPEVLLQALKDDVDGKVKALTGLKTASGVAAAAAIAAGKPQDPKDVQTANVAFLKANAALTDAKSKLARALAYKAAGTLADVGHPVLCTTFGDFTRSFGGFSLDGLLPPPVDNESDAAKNVRKKLTEALATPGPGQNQLAHGVFGFFNNGGVRCYVMRYPTLQQLRDPMSLAPLETIDEISLVLAPGIVDPEVQTNIIDHCTNMSDRFAILDAPEKPADLSLDSIRVAHNTDYGALYFPWIEVFDKPTQIVFPDGDGELFVAPSGHMAGIYSRVDHERGVHKAPANEVVRGATDVEIPISKGLQDGLNPGGVNIIRKINNNFTVWGARTIGGDFNADLKYINVRRTLLFLRKSIDHSTQWVVFEPNDRTLWAKIVRNVTAFLTTVWRDGALFGSTPQEAFYVRCDDETNPPENRELGRVTTEIGVAIVRPAEFVIFRIEQWQPPQA